MIEVIVVDDHPVTRLGLSLFLNSTQDINVVGEAECGMKALELVSALKPDILLLDHHLPDMSGAQVTAEVQKLGLKTRVLGFSGFSDEDFIIEMLDAGAQGYILKTESLNFLQEAIKAIARGETWLSPTIASMFLHRGRKKFVDNALLSHRELEVLLLLAKGCSNLQIAKSLMISRATVKNHLSKIYNILAVRSRAEAITWAWSNGFTALEISPKYEKKKIGQSS